MQAEKNELLKIVGGWQAGKKRFMQKNRYEQTVRWRRERSKWANKQFLKCKQRNVIFPCFFFFSRAFTASLGLIVRY